ncbi:hypothetical protein NC652_040037 [Populus alba x Populus x berolinensis]|nr:hypothetical protein NC652_040037 [Populus alba x Populus x berolinensis]
MGGKRWFLAHFGDEQVVVSGWDVGLFISGMRPDFECTLTSSGIYTARKREGFERMKSLAELRKSDKNVFMNLFNSAHPDQDQMSWDEGKSDPIMSQGTADRIPAEEFTALHRVAEDRRLYADRLTEMACSQVSMLRSENQS